MVRTRDFLLFILVFVFLLIGIGTTIVSESSSRSALVDQPIEVYYNDGVTILEADRPGEIDRASNLAALRAKLAKGEGEIVQGAPVFTSVDSPTGRDEVSVDFDIAGLSLDGQPGSRSEAWCVPSTFYATALSWPSFGVRLEIADGYRMVRHETVTVNGTSSADVSSVSRPLLQLPLSPQNSGAQHCLDSVYVGVSPDGTLIRNSDTWRYLSVAANTHIGYARDGNPIYGAGAEESLLDACGGHNDGSGYRYHIRSAEPFILGCFAAAPQPFIE